MKKILFTMILALASGAALAQWQPGQGVANAPVRGENPQDVVFVQRGGGANYGYRAYETPVGLTILPWAAPNFESTVKGVRFNFGWGHHAGMYGLDVGLFGNSDSFVGIGVNLLGNVSRGAGGLQIGLANVTHGTANGMQIGVVNYAERLEGVQIGVLNFAATQWTMPIINIAW